MTRININNVDIYRVEWQPCLEKQLTLNGMSPSRPQILHEARETGQATDPRNIEGVAVDARKAEYHCRHTIGRFEGGCCRRDIRTISRDCRDGRMTMHVPAFSCEYSFDELSIRLCDRWETGLLLYGHAELTSAGAGYEDEFCVSAIRLDGGARLARPNSSGSADSFELELFRRIAAVIEDGGRRQDVMPPSSLPMSWSSPGKPIVIKLTGSNARET